MAFLAMAYGKSRMSLMKVRNIGVTLVIFVQYQGRKAGTGQVLLSLFDWRREDQVRIQSSTA